MGSVLFKNARVFDGFAEECAENQSVLVEGGRIREISGRPIKAAKATVIDVAGRTLMPGLIDLHIHAYASDVSFQKIESAGNAYRAAHAARMLSHALDCGFTTVRDIGGGDWSLWRAIEDKLIRAPRFFYAGRVLTMTGGHGDFRSMGQGGHEHGCCACAYTSTVSVAADGVDECIKAVREELRHGAHCIKIMGSGGVASPSDPIWMNQYREDETRAIVEECTQRRTYVSAHCHPASAIRRSVEFGVRVIEHGTLIDDATAQFVADRGAYVVPTMVIIFALKELGPALGFPAVSQEKVAIVADHALEGLDRMRRHGVRLGFGTDLLGETYIRQAQEFSIRARVFEPVEILRQATSMGAEILMQEGQLGCVKDGAHADLIVVDGDPLRDISLLARDGQALSVIMRGGELVKNTIA
jgi:imidazolonepropionase-like amidohydrolase